MRAVATLRSVFPPFGRPPETWRSFVYLLWSLAGRDLKIRYKQSLLGIAWALLAPLSMMWVFTFIFTSVAGGSLAPALDVPYPLFAYIGLVPWTFFANSLNGSVNSLVANRNLVTKVYFPREVFPLSCVLASFADACVASVLWVGLVFYFEWRTDWTFVLHPTVALIPLILLVQVALTIGLGMLLAMGNLFYRDVRQIFGVTIQLWMFVSDVVIPLKAEGARAAAWVGLNPMASIIGAYRDCAIHGRLPDAGPFLLACAFSVLVLIVGWRMFRHCSYKFAEYI